MKLTKTEKTGLIDATGLNDFVWDGVPCSIGEAGCDNSTRHLLPGKPILAAHKYEDTVCANLHIEHEYFDIETGHWSFISVLVPLKELFMADLLDSQGTIDYPEVLDGWEDTLNEFLEIIKTEKDKSCG